MGGFGRPPANILGLWVPNDALTFQLCEAIASQARSVNADAWVKPKFVLVRATAENEWTMLLILFFINLALQLSWFQKIVSGALALLFPGKGKKDAKATAKKKK